MSAKQFKALVVKQNKDYNEMIMQKKVNKLKESNLMQ